MVKIFPKASKDELSPIISSLNKEKTEKIKFASLVETISVETSYQMNEFEGRNKVMDLLRREEEKNVNLSQYFKN